MDMKILVVGSARTASSALCEHLKINNCPMENFGEYLSHRYKNQYQSLFNILRDNNKVNLRIKNSIRQETNNLFATVPNYILKVLGCHLGGLSFLFKEIQPEKYDKIFCIERHNFFNQVCSHSVAIKSNIWHRRLDLPEILQKYESIKNTTFTIGSMNIITMAYDIAHYLKCKKYLLDNEINFEQVYFTDYIFQNNLHIGNYGKNDFNYNNLVSNYKIGKDIDEIFLKHFNYNTLYHNFENFQHDVYNYFK